MKTMKVLVTRGTGTVGGEVVKAPLRRGADVRALTRRRTKPSTFPGSVEIALGDLSDPVSVAEAIQQHGDPDARFAALLGHQPRTYSRFAEELAREWAA
jgi:nucleoside-diphosphate-sugar epimerase